MVDTQQQVETQRRQHKKKIAIILSILVLVVAVLLGVLQWQNTSLNPLSEDATLDADIVHIASTVPGKIQTLYVKDGDKVKKGQLLFTIDPEFFELRVEQARAELAFAEATLKDRQRLIKAETHNQTITAEQIDRAKTNLQQTQTTHARLSALGTKGYVPKEQVDQANTLRKDAEISLRQAYQQADAAEALIGTGDAEVALVQMRQKGVAMAERELRHTQIVAPEDGYVVGLKVAEGENLLPDLSVFTLIVNQPWYANAMYRETELKNIKIGMCATVYVLSNPDVKVTGRVQSIGRGVSSTDMVSIPRGLPYVQKSVNWVRVAQRFPVRILLEQTPENEAIFRMGASATTILHHDTTCD